jgi:hypothetical protein
MRTVARKKPPRFPFWTSLLSVVMFAVVSVPTYYGIYFPPPILFGALWLAVLLFFDIVFFSVWRTKEREKPEGGPYLTIMAMTVISNSLISFLWFWMEQTTVRFPSWAWWARIFVFDGIFFFLWQFFWIFTSVGALQREDGDSGKGFAAAIGAGLGGALFQFVVPFIVSALVSGQGDSSGHGNDLLAGMWLYRLLLAVAAFLFACIFFFLAKRKILRWRATNYKRVSLATLSALAICALFLILLVAAVDINRIWDAWWNAISLLFYMLILSLWEAASLEGLWGIKFLNGR